MCDRVTLLYGRKLTEHCQPAMMEKIKIIIKGKKKKTIRRWIKKDQKMVEMVTQQWEQT